MGQEAHRLGLHAGRLDTPQWVPSQQLVFHRRLEEPIQGAVGLRHRARGETLLAGRPSRRGLPASPGASRASASPTQPRRARAGCAERPSDRRPGFHHAELALASAKKELFWAHYRLDHARDRLDRFGPLARLRHRGRQEKASTLDQIDRFAEDVRKAEVKIACCEQTIEELRPELDRRLQWDVDPCSRTPACAPSTPNWPSSGSRPIKT